jgi:hypothetical protein
MHGRISLLYGGLIRLGVLSAAFSFFMMAAGCYQSEKDEVDGRDALDAPVEGTDQASDGLYFDCPATKDVRVAISVRQSTEEDRFPATGTVTAVTKEADGMLAITIDLAASGQDPDEIAIQIPIPENVDIDLHPGDEVEVEYTSSMISWWPIVNLEILKNEEFIVHAGTCTQHCIHDSLVFSPLTFSLLSGRCEPLLDIFGCAFYERLGYSISCESGDEEVEVFDHGYGYVPCGPGYHVILGDLEKMVERLEPPCMDIPLSRAQVIIIKHGNGLASSGP